MWVLLWTVTAGAADPTAAERVEAATRVLQQLRADAAAGTATPEDVYRWSVRVMEAERDAGTASALQSHAARMRDLASVVAGQVSQGTVPMVALEQVRFFLAEANGWLSAQAPPPAPAPAAAAPPPPALDACFDGCEAAYRTCAQTAEHFRLGMGGLPADPECAKKAESSCGTGRSQVATDCRARDDRACQAAKMAAECTLTQTQCSARCR